MFEEPDLIHSYTPPTGSTMECSALGKIMKEK
jgi:hypothetical protein